MVVAVLTITVVELFGQRVYPVPSGTDMSDPVMVAAYMSTAPAGASMVVVFGWFLGAALGGWTAVKVGLWPPAAWIVAALIAGGGIFNATQIPAPLWMQVATILAPTLGGLAAHMLGGRKRA